MQFRAHQALDLRDRRRRGAAQGADVLARDLAEGVRETLRADVSSRFSAPFAQVSRRSAEIRTDA